MKKITNLLYITLSLVAVSLIASCSLDEDPKYTLNSKTIFSDKTAAETSLYQCYGHLGSQNLYGQFIHQVTIANGFAWAKTDGNTKESRYEGYGPGGVAVMVDCLTDNKNRTVSEVRHAFSKAGGNLGTSGSVAFQFSEQGVLFYESVADEDALMEAALEGGADDVEFDNGSAEIITTPEDYAAVYETMEKAGFVPDDSEVTMRAENLSPVSADDADKVMRLIERLEELDDTQNVYTNADFPDDFNG